MLRKKWIIFCLSLVTGIFTRGLSQNNFRFEHITVNDGLAHSDAVAVLQDKDGFIWIGTNNGIDRYDGYELKNYLMPNSNFNGLYNNRIQSLRLAKDGRIWAIADEQGVYFYDPQPDRFLSLAELSPDEETRSLLRQISARAVLDISDDRLCVATRSHGLLLISFTPERKIAAVRKIPFLRDGANVTVFRLEEDPAGNLWVGTLGLGLWHLKKDKNTFIPARAHQWPHENVRALLFRPDHTLWVASDNSVARISTGSAPRVQWLKGSFASINCIYEDSFKRFWIGTNFGLHLIEGIRPESGDVLTYDSRVFSVDSDNPFAINSNRVHQVFEDSFNNLWFAASAGGLNKINLLAKPFGVINRMNNHELPDDYINTIRNEQDVLWIGTRNGFSRYDKVTGTFRNFLNNPVPGSTTHISVSSIYDARDGYLWVASRENSIYLLNKKTLSLRRLADVPGKQPWAGIEPLCIREDGQGRIWIATFYAGIYIFDKKGNFIQTLDTGNSPLPSDKITSLLYDKEEEVMWASTRNAGVCKLRLNNHQLTVLNHFFFNPESRESMKVNYAWPLHKDSKGNLWAGTLGGGLHLIHKVNGKEVITRYDQWLPESNVETILEADNGDLWIGGRGLYRFDPEKKTYLHFDVADGLQSNSFKIGAAAKDADGTLYFGGINGISYFNPSRISLNPYPPKMQITRVRIVNYELSATEKNPRAILSGPFSSADKITLKDSENDFTIEFVGLNFHNPRKQQYAYKLEGYHENWIPLLPGQRIAAFASLPAGDYTFMVRADNGDGVWAEEPAALKLSILPPWYKTWWAYTFYVITALAALTWYRRIRARQRELQNKIALEQMEKQKEKELSDLKLNFFTNVSHELRTPLTLIINPAEDLMQAVEPQTEARHKAELVHKQANKLLSLVNQLMDLRKIESGNMKVHLQNADIIAFIREIFLIFKIKADELNIRYTLDVFSEEVPVSFDPAKLEIILTNLLSNAFKYTPEGGDVRLSVKQPDEDRLLIRVADNGPGIRPEDLKHIFEPFYQVVRKDQPKAPGTGIGLSLVRELVQMLEGEIEVQSEPGAGSAFEVILPFNPVSSGEKIHPESTLSPVTHTEVPLPENMDETLSENHLLIVEDNADLRTYLGEIFAHHLKVSMAKDGKEGLERALEALPDIILSDVMMPEMNGLELCEKIKNNPKTAHIPVVLITARAAAVHELEGLESGADDYIVKPFNPRILFSKIQSLLINRRKLREHFQRQILMEPTTSGIPDTDRAFIQSAMEIVENNLTNKQFGVQSLVSDSGMSQSAYYRKLKNITGQSVVEFIRDVRLKRAAQLLVTGRFRVTEVMDLVGIEDYKYFRSAFQKLHHVSPSEYAKSYEKNV